MPEGPQQSLGVQPASSGSGCALSTFWESQAGDSAGSHGDLLRLGVTWQVSCGWQLWVGAASSKGARAFGVGAVALWGGSGAGERGSEAAGEGNLLRHNKAQSFSPRSEQVKCRVFLGLNC